MADTPSWVSVSAKFYAECTVDRIFEELKQVVEQDVGVADELPAWQRRSYRFRFRSEADGRFTVDRFKDEGLAALLSAGDRVSFSIDRQAANGPWILVEGYRTLFTVSPAPAPDLGKCRFRVGDDILLSEVSEVSKIALSPLFFDREYLP